MKKIPIHLGVRVHTLNRLTLPVVLHQLENSGLEDSFEVTLIRNTRQLHRFVTYSRQGLLIYSFMTPQIFQVQREIRWVVKHRTPRLTLIAGGPHTTGDPQSSLKLGFDVSYCGPVETGFVVLLERFLADELPDTPLVFRAPELDNLDRSLPLSRLLPTSPPLEITRGCYWNCRFCQTSCHQARHRSPDSIRHYFEELQNRNHHRRVNFICPSAFEYGARDGRNLNVAAVANLLEFFKSRGTVHLEFGIFPSETRPNTFRDEMVHLVSQYCSNRKITIGAQSGSDRLLKEVRRGHRVDHIESACEMAVRHHLRPSVDIMVGFPGETQSDRRETILLVRKLSRLYRARIHVHYFLPLAGTDLADSDPRPLDYRTIDTLERLEKGGVCTGWWKKGQKLSRRLVEQRDRLREKSIEYQEISHPTQMLP